MLVVLVIFRVRKVEDCVKIFWFYLGRKRIALGRDNAFVLAGFIGFHKVNRMLTL